MGSRRILGLLAALGLAAFGGTAPVCAGETLFAALGGEGALHNAVDRFADLVVGDARINFTFAEADMPKFKRLLYEQLCELSGGPCHYSGRDMHAAHAKLHVTNAQFNALAEDLYIALQKAGVPYRVQNKLMALLAPMQRDMVQSSHGEPARRP